MTTLDDAFEPLDRAADHADEPGSDQEKWQPILPVPDDAPALPQALIDRCAPVGHAASQCWSYRDAEGRLVGHVIRYDRPGSAVSEPSKEIKPFTFRAGPDGRREWRCQGLPHPRPLYRLDEIAARSDATVLVVEGEKAADAARQRFRDLVAMTSAGGNKAASKTDWTPLSGRHVTIWRDADDAGLRYEDDVAEILKQIGAASVKHVEIVSRGVV